MITKQMAWTIKNIIRRKGTELIEGLGSELKKNCWKTHRDERRVQNAEQAGQACHMEKCMHNSNAVMLASRLSRMSHAPMHPPHPRPTLH
jgi:hypothetical protein